MKFTMARIYGLPNISPAEVEQRLGEAGFFIFDNNAIAGWRQHHLPGAKHLEPADFEEADLPADKNATLVFYCAGPMSGAAPYAGMRARNLGYRHVYVMTAGINGWVDADKPIEKG